MQVDGEKVRLQVVFSPLALEDVNHLWSTQGDVKYRPSVAYEMALTPVVPKTRAKGTGRVGRLGIDVRATMDALYDPFQGVIRPPPVDAVAVEIRRPDWAPRICFVHNGECSVSMSFVRDTPNLAALELHVWVAGDPAKKVALKWDIWHRETGWTTEDASVPESSPLGTTIDPDTPPPDNELVALDLPFSDKPGQAVLYAIHYYKAPGEDADRPMRSNPIMLTLYKAGQ
jgi:hypothetical protein